MLLKIRKFQISSGFRSRQRPQNRRSWMLLRKLSCARTGCVTLMEEGSLTIRKDGSRGSTGEARSSSLWKKRISFCKNIEDFKGMDKYFEDQNYWNNSESSNFVISSRILKSIKSIIHVWARCKMSVRIQTDKTWDTCTV